MQMEAPYRVEQRKNWTTFRGPSDITLLRLEQLVEEIRRGSRRPNVDSAESKTVCLPRIADPSGRQTSQVAGLLHQSPVTVSVKTIRVREPLHRETDHC